MKVNEVQAFTSVASGQGGFGNIFLFGNEVVLSALWLMPGTIVVDGSICSYTSVGL